MYIYIHTLIHNISFFILLHIFKLIISRYSYFQWVIFKLLLLIIYVPHLEGWTVSILHGEEGIRILPMSGHRNLNICFLRMRQEISLKRVSYTIITVYMNYSYISYLLKKAGFLSLQIWVFFSLSMVPIFVS